MTNKQPRILKLSENKMFLGVIAGIGEYFNIDIALLRIGFLLVVVFSGFFPGILFYFLAYIVMREQS
jgi:phage shock protein C